MARSHTPKDYPTQEMRRACKNMERMIREKEKELGIQREEIKQLTFEIEVHQENLRAPGIPDWRIKDLDKQIDDKSAEKKKAINQVRILSRRLREMENHFRIECTF